jgi:3-hydroxyisobutyrate dehydrogenase-like beta-hydroxyacid dehydrogenase
MTTPSKKEISLGFIGLGNMGLPMAINLLKAGYQLRVYNRTPHKADPLIALGAKEVSSPSDVIEPGGIVFTMLADDAAVESIAGSNSDFADRFAGGGIHVSMSTIAPQTARNLAEHHAKKGVAYLATPVIGRPDRAAAGTLFILLAGESNAKQVVEPLLKNLGQRIFDFGEKPWQANVAKLVVNFNIAAAIESMAEAFTLAEKEEIPRLKIAELLSETLLAGAVYKGYGDLVARHQYRPAGFRLRLGWKDVRLVLQVAQESETPMPIGSLLGNRFLSALAKNRGDLDWSALALGASDDAGVTPPFALFASSEGTRAASG